MKDFRGTFVNKNRDAWVEINLGNLEHNVIEIRDFLKNNCKNNNVKEPAKKEPPDLFAVIKADGYGHGSLMCADTLIACGVKEFGVASIDEGIELRENKITNPVLVLGASPIWAFENAIKYDIAISIFNDEHLETANQLYKRLNKKLKAHIKLDTGMNRIGVDSEQSYSFIKKVLNAPYIDLKGIFTHFADVENEDIFNTQIKKFQNAIEPYSDEFKKRNVKVHCLNSPGIFLYGKYCYDMVRMGVIMWGLTPFSKNIKLPFELYPVMGLKARITNIHTLKKGDGISYGHIFKADKDIKVATIPIGYADGLDRRLSNNLSANLNGKTIKQIGRITMDQVMFDVSDVDCSTGDVIVLLGEENKEESLDIWAKKLDTINYELACRLKMRLPRIYVR